MYTGTQCRTTPQQLTELVDARSAAEWSGGAVGVAAGGGACGGRWAEHYVVETDEQLGELVAIVVSVRHRHVTEQWFLERVVVVSDPQGPQRVVRCFPCHDVVQARVTLRTGNGLSHSAIQLHLP